MIGQRTLTLLAIGLAALTTTNAHGSLRGRILQTSAGASASSFYDAMLEAVNNERSKQGLSKLCYNTKLKKAAQLHSEDQANNNLMTHTGTDGSKVGDRVTRQDFKWTTVGENVAAGQVDVSAVMTAWMNSETHRKNILGDYTFFGMGYAFNGNGDLKHFWTQDFASGSGESCEGSANPNPSPTPNPGPAPTPNPGPAPTPTSGPSPNPTPSPSSNPTPAPSSSPIPVSTPTPNPGGEQNQNDRGMNESGAASAPSNAPKKRRDCHA